MGKYHVAQICLNGHTVTSKIDESPEYGEKYCSICGAKTITQCPSCQSDIRGKYEVPGVVSIGYGFAAPSYCYNCGKPYPWTESALEATRVLIEEDEQMSLAQKDGLIETLPAVITETPKSSLAAARIKKAMGVAGKITADALSSFIADFACELVKKQLGM